MHPSCLWSTCTPGVQMYIANKRCQSSTLVKWLDLKKQLLLKFTQAITINWEKWANLERHSTLPCSVLLSSSTSDNTGTQASGTSSPRTYPSQLPKIFFFSSFYSATSFLARQIPELLFHSFFKKNGLPFLIGEEKSSAFQYWEIKYKNPNAVYPLSLIRQESDHIPDALRGFAYFPKDGFTIKFYGKLICLFPWNYCWFTWKSVFWLFSVETRS